ncbi:MAG TPA: DUF5676 family membrane protein [Patescibacteria group bacterium]|nr:DUF5676 family membrane protein [Patescibacteria group bacterium]
MKSYLYTIPNALALTTAIIYVACRILVALFPDGFFAIGQSWFHGIVLNRLDTSSLTMTSFIVGLISSTIAAWIIGYIYAKAHEMFSK